VSDLVNKYSRKVALIIVVLLFLVACNQIKFSISTESFQAANAMESIRKLLSFGARYPGSEGQQKTIDFLKEELTKLDCSIEEQAFFHQNIRLTNLIAKKGNSKKVIIIGTHFDTRMVADRDADLIKQSQPVPGANDGSSGVAILLELARILPKDNRISYWLVFFDGEDQGNIQGWDWILGSSFFAKTLAFKPMAVVILDMVGDRDLDIFQEGFSDRQLQNNIWQIARQMGLEDYFHSNIKYTITDDHLPFIQLGIPSALVIDLDYPYWHTIQDTYDKISAESLKNVGSTIFSWIKDQEKIIS
jgi:glutaminyl-peptide cyclotransferase